MRRPGSRRIAKAAFVVGLGAILYLIATNSGAGWLYVVAAGIGAVLAVSAPLPWWNVRGVEATRRAPVVATAGEPFECSLEVRNTGRLARHLLEVEDRFAGTRDGRWQCGSGATSPGSSGTPSRTRVGASTRAGTSSSSRGHRSGSSTDVAGGGRPRTS